MEYKIIWESQHYDFNPISGKLIQEEQDEDSEYSDVDEGNLQKQALDILQGPVKNMTMTPFGLWAVDDSMHPMKQFRFWMAHCNFNITKKAKNIIKKIPGVEVLRVLTRYRFIIAVGTAFTSEHVKIAIQNALCGINVVDTELSDGKLLSNVIKDLQSNCKDWALYIMPNGSYDYVGTDVDNDIPFLDKKSQLYDALSYSNGIYITSDTKCNLIEKK